MKNALLIGLALAVCVPPLTGCGKIRQKMEEKAAEKAIEGASGGNVQIDNGNVTVKDKNGTGSVQMGNAAKVPSDWPSEVPVYPNAKVIMAIESNNKDSKGYSLSLESTDSVDQVTSFYKSKLSGYKSSLDMSTGDGHMMSLENPAGMQVTVTASKSGKNTSITIFAGKKNKA